MKKLYILALLAALNWSAGLFAANLTISPEVITNDYAGTITFTITGLSMEQGVRLEKYLDQNTNGVLDATDTLVQTFKVRDGKQPLFGGVRNINIPADEDAVTNGQIVARLWYPGISAGLDRIAGTYLLKVVDGTTGLGLVTNSLVIKQVAYSQGVSGQVTGGGQPLAYTPVVLLPGGSEPLTGTVTDGSGNYNLYAPPGEYLVLALKPGYLCNFDAGAAVSPNTFSTVNLALATATRTISGKLQDSATATGLPGVFLQAESEAGQFVTTFTDANGNYSLTVADGSWKIEPDGGHLAQAGYIGWDHGTNITVSGADLTGLTLGSVKANALIFGRVLDQAAEPLYGFNVSANDSANVLNARGKVFTQNGDYCLGVSAGNWNVGFDSEALQAMGYLSVYTNAVLTANQATEVNFTLYQFSAHILGRLIDNNSNALPNILVTAWYPPATRTQAETDSDGYFDLPAFGGTWELGIDMNDAQNQGLMMLTNFSLTLTNGETRSNIVFQVQHSTAQLCGRVQAGSGPGVGNVAVHLWIDNSPVMLTVQTDDSGNFCAGVFTGQWNIAVEQSDLQSRNLLSASPTTVNVVDGQNQNGVTVPVQTISGQITGTVHNNNGNPIPNLNVWAYVVVNTIQYSQLVSTDNNGYFSFGACNGTWQIGLDCNGLEGRGYQCPQNVETNFAGGSSVVNFTVQPPVPLQITTTLLPSGTVGLSYSQALFATGGQYQYQWGLAPASDPLPPGLQLSGSGMISGTPTQPGEYQFIARVSDSSSMADTNITITIQGLTQVRPTITQYWRQYAGVFDLVLENLTSGQYQIQVSTNITAGWTTLITTNVTGTTLHITDPSANSTNRFYRIYRP